MRFIEYQDQEHANHDARYALQNICRNTERRRNKAVSANRRFKEIIAENHEKFPAATACDICHRLMFFQQTHHDFSD